MKKVFVLLVLVFLCNSNMYSQTAKKVNSFPEDYLEKTITFSNTRYWPILFEFDGYYTIQIDISSSIYEEREWGFKTFNKIIGVVKKNIAKQMISKDIGGYNSYYYGTVTGKVIKSDKIFGSDYLFVINKVINHPPNEPESVIDQFEIE